MTQLRSGDLPVPLRPIVLAGPTGSGKSALAIQLAQAVGGEIVCGDSRQVYAGMRIGAAGPSAAEGAAVPHHGYHVVPPTERYDAGRYLVDTDRHVDAVLARGRVPIVVGGAGMYLRVWRYGLADVPPKDPAVRARLEEELAVVGSPTLHARLAVIDPEACRAIDPHDGVRLVRALEIWHVTGQRPSALRQSHGNAAPRREATWVLLTAPVPWLNERIEARAHAMFAAGLVAETEALAERVGDAHALLSTMGYQEAWDLAQGRVSRASALARTAIRQRQYAKRQRTWFRKETWWSALDASAPDLLPLALAQVGLAAAPGPRPTPGDSGAP